MSTADHCRAKELLSIVDPVCHEKSPSGS
jgi:hypothetical protein